ncbi:MAG TPA: 50S ribosomal protein L21 [Candidatus Deferrimicrobium sp.]|nr:50S ribosomal protein L21 [Candidatus Deferrimicrobium sp.]
MYAIFRISGFQFSGEEGSVVKVPLQTVGQGNKLDITDVLLIKQGETAIVGNPTVAGARIEADVLDSGRGDKIKIYKYKKRTKSRRRQGHRQGYTEIRISKIVAPQT